MTTSAAPDEEKRWSKADGYARSLRQHRDRWKRAALGHSLPLDALSSVLSGSSVRSSSSSNDAVAKGLPHLRCHGREE